MLDRSHRPLDRPPSRVVARAAAPPPTSAARCSARARSAGRATRTSRSARRKPTARASSPSSRRASAASSTCRSASTHATAYAKGTEAIADVLVAAGAVDVALALEEQAVLAATRADANRLANADHANLVRTSRAAHAQLEALRRLDVDALPDDLREIALLRLRHPTASTAELARRCKPGLTKASRLPPAPPLAGTFAGS